MRKDFLGDSHDADIELANSVNLGEIDYTDDFVCLFESAEHAQRALNKLARALAPSGMCPAPPQCKLLQDWMSIVLKSPHAAGQGQ